MGDTERVVQGESAKVSASVRAFCHGAILIPPLILLVFVLLFWSAVQRSGQGELGAAICFARAPGLRCRACPRFAHAAGQEITYLLGTVADLTRPRVVPGRCTVRRGRTLSK